MRRLIPNAIGGRMETPSTDYRLIPLTQGQFAKVDPEDYEDFSCYSWFAQWSNKTKSYYAIRHLPISNGKRHMERMHRRVLGLTRDNPMRGDHINLDTLDNRRLNLRAATQAQNRRNGRAQRNNTSGFKGVSYHKGKRKFQANIKVNQKQVYLGSYSTAEQAHDAYCEGARRLHGEFARVD